MQNLIIIAGPTASGKTEAAIKMALELGTEIISADSRQFYREMNIGTAKPTQQELSLVKHHLVDFISITENYTAADYARDAEKILHQVFLDKPSAVMTGGSGLFIKAATEGFDDIPDIDPKVRENLNEIFNNEGLGPLLEILEKTDPVSFSRTDLQNPRRVIRALEVSISTGKPYSSFLQKEKQSLHNRNLIKIALDRPREELYERINNRCGLMLEQGLLDEVKALYPLRQYPAVQTIGYTEFFDWMDGNCSFDEAVEKFRQHTRNYAKRQLTWFRKDKEYTWFHPNEMDRIISFVKENLK